jgi:hypothetical protein
VEAGITDAGLGNVAASARRPGLRAAGVGRRGGNRIGWFSPDEQTVWLAVFCEDD